MQEDSQLRADLTAANNIIASLWEEQLDTRDWLLAMEGMFDFIPSENPKTMWAWETRRQGLHHEPTSQEQPKMDWRTDDHSSELYSEIRCM